MMALERAVAEYEARWDEHRAELSKTEQRGSELELRILAQRNTYVQSAADELKDTSARIFDLEERLRPSKDAAERQRIAAPIDGEVVGLRVFSHGGVVGPREVLMEIVPRASKTLIVEARIRPEDINHVRAGTEADVQPDRLPAAHHAAGRGQGDLRLGRPHGGAARPAPPTTSRTSTSPSARWPTPAT